MSAPQPDVSSEPSSPNDIFRTIAAGISPPAASSGVLNLPSANSPPSEPTPNTPKSDTTLPSSSISLECSPLSPRAGPPSWLWLREHDQAFVGVCVAVFLLLTGYHWAKLSGRGAVPLEIDRQAARRYDYRIDINSAGLIEWTQIEGIGEATAQRILDDRAAHGPFRNIADLRRVKGIGPATLVKIRPFVRDSSPPESPVPPNGSSSDSDRP